MASTELGTATYSTASLAGFTSRGKAATAYDTLNDKVWVYITGATTGSVQGTYLHKFTPTLGSTTTVESSIDVLGTTGLNIIQPGTSAAHEGYLFVDRFNSDVWLSQYNALTDSPTNGVLTRIDNVTGALISSFTIEDLGLTPLTGTLTFISGIDQFSDGMLLLNTHIEGQSFISYYKCNPITGDTTLLFHGTTNNRLSVSHNDFLYKVSGGIVTLLDLTGTVISISSTTAINFTQESVQFKELFGSTPGFNIVVENTVATTSETQSSNMSQRFTEFDFNSWTSFDYTTLPIGYAIRGGRYAFESFSIPDRRTYHPRKKYLFSSLGENFDKPVTQLIIN